MKIMSLPDLLAQLRVRDEEYREHLLRECKTKDDALIERIKSSGKMTLGRIREVSWVATLKQQREKLSAQQLEVFAKNRREKNEINLRRISKNPRHTKEYVEKLRKAFEENAVADIEAERKRLDEEDAKGLSRVSDQQIFDKQEEAFMKNERGILERLEKMNEECEKRLLENVQKSDEEFYHGLVEELTKPSDGPAPSFTVPKFQMIVSMRDAKRSKDMAEWHVQRDREFLKVRVQVDSDNAKLLSLM